MLGRTVILALIGAGIVAGDRLTDPPETQAEAERHLERPVLAYHLWDGTGFVVVEYGGTVHFDRLVLDPFSMEWPPLPRWQWTGNWWSLNATTDPASVALASTGDPVPDDPYRYASGPTPEGGQETAAHVLFGQVNDLAITELQVEIDGAWQAYPVAAPGFAVRLPKGSPKPTAVRWLDGNGIVVWTASSIPYG